MKFIENNHIPTQRVNHPDSNVVKQLLIPNGIIPSITNISLATLKPNEHVPLHSHADMYEIYLIKQGTLHCIINNKTITANEGDCLVIEPNEQHEITNKTRKIVTFFYFGCQV